VHAVGPKQQVEAVFHGLGMTPKKGEWKTDSSTGGGPGAISFAEQQDRLGGDGLFWGATG
jgi:hypothetical protein